MEQNSYLRVYRTNIANHLPEGVLESSLVQAGSLESEQPPFLQRTLGAEAPGPRSSPEARTLLRGKQEGGRGVGVEIPALSRRQEHGKIILLLFLLGATVEGNFKFSFMAATMETITQKF